ncbi:hypothetical protein CPT_Melville_094 [Salmonella phage Melville]|uniref:Uncharacterized protein n=1 Tax=Salmonella phage Melville TaxID=2041413 RepID=A0A2D1GM90_9CAUD|nr:hypothetical protein FDI73_gp094 [Salmonella phage Melville]ATN93068.1 hypothetical protein CPT_Melville_094 [Salmonella phage Melville]UPW42467.1 hypothetical protein EBPHNEJP_00169 [Salmonella phage CF-SP2]
MIEFITLYGFETIISIVLLVIIVLLIIGNSNDCDEF